MQSWNEIVQRNAANVLNAALRVLGNLADAEDVSQEVFTEAFRKWDAQPDTQWEGILRRMAVFRSIDLLRSKKNTQTLSMDLPDDKNSPISNAISRELAHRLRIEIGNLPPRESQVFCLTYFEQQTAEQIAQSLDISKPSVATALSKARAKLELAFRKISTGEPK